MTLALGHRNSSTLSNIRVRPSRPSRAISFVLLSLRQSKYVVVSEDLTTPVPASSVTDDRPCCVVGGQNRFRRVIVGTAISGNTQRGTYYGLLSEFAARANVN